MKYLNDLFNKQCKPAYTTYEKISKDIILIDNFFENFVAAREFFLSREKWHCIGYQISSKPGYESLFPEWIGRSLMEKYILENKIIDDLSSYDIDCNFYYDEMPLLELLTSSSHFPHVDNYKNNSIDSLICLVNLNEVPISTNFYAYKNLEHCTIEMKDEWNNYLKENRQKLIECYGSDQKITKENVKQFFDEKMNFDKVREVRYNPNQAIIYSASLFHCANTTKEFSENNPRSVLRISFDVKIK